MSFYKAILKSISKNKKGLAILIDPDKFEVSKMDSFLKLLPKESTHIFVGGSTVSKGDTARTVKAIKSCCSLPIFLFPGDHSQLTPLADAVLFLSLLSGRNPEYLIGQQLKSVVRLQSANLEIIPTAYLLVDGGNESAVARVTNTSPISQKDIKLIVHTALAGQYMGAKLVYLEAGSGAAIPVRSEIIKAVKQSLDIPLIVGGGIRTEAQKQEAYEAGADLVVMGTVFELKTT